MPHAAMDPVAVTGFHDARLYEAYRPSYPAGAVDDLLQRLGVLVEGDKNVVEIGAGTGKFTEELSKRASDDTAAGSGSGSGSWSVVAVEPHDDMRAELVAKKLPHVTVVDNHAAAMPTVADGSADAVVIAQAFHWFDNQETLREIHRILKPGGFVGVIWNVEDYNKPRDWPASTRWEKRLNDIVLALPSEHARFRDMQWPAAFAEAAAAVPPLFAPLTDARVEWETQVSKESLRKRLLTISQIANLERGTEADYNDPDVGNGKATSRQQLWRLVDEALLEPDAEKNDRGEITLHARTYYAWAQRL